MEEQTIKAEETKKPADLLAEILATEQETLKNIKFIRNYFHWQIIWSSIKWTIFIIIIVLGFVSLRAAASYLQGYGDVLKSYSDQVNATNQQMNSLKNLINIK